MAAISNLVGEFNGLVSTEGPAKAGPLAFGTFDVFPPPRSAFFRVQCAMICTRLLMNGFTFTSHEQQSQNRILLYQVWI